MCHFAAFAADLEDWCDWWWRRQEERYFSRPDPIATALREALLPDKGDIMKIIRKLDLKHAITDDGQLVKYKDDEIIAPVPLEEPLVIFRGRDRLSVSLLYEYKELCQIDGCNDFQLKQIDELIARFQKFASEHPEVMKQPGVTRGL